MKEQFVTYKIALAVKELGFDEKCFCTYSKGILSRNPSNKIDGKPIQYKPYTWRNSIVHNSIVTAPLWQQLIDWFREKCDIQICEFTDGYKLYSWKNENLIDTISDGISLYDCREQAILKAIELCKKNL